MHQIERSILIASVMGILIFMCLFLGEIMMILKTPVVVSAYCDEREGIEYLITSNGGITPRLTNKTDEGVCTCK